VSGWTFLGICALISLVAFLNGVRFARMSEERIADGRLQIEMPPFLTRGRTPTEQVHLLGRIFMITAPLFFLLVAALCFGLLGPVQGVETIKLT
jgi:hypothetical protein